MGEDLRRGSEIGMNLSLERRGVPRLTEPFPALVRGRRCGRGRFEEQVTLDNLSAHGLEMRMVSRPEVGDTLFVVVRFNLGAATRAAGPGVAIKGVVLRSRLIDEHHRVALVFVRHRMLFAAETAL